MKNLAKRTLSLLLAALMVLALIPATPHAHAAAVNEAVMGVNNSGAAYTNNHISVVTASSGVKAYKLAGNVPCYAYAIPKSGYGIFALSADFLDAEFDGKVTVEIEYLNAYSGSLTILEDYSFSYVAKDGSTKVATPKTTKAGTAGFSSALPATIAVYELEDALFNGTIGGKTGAIAIQNASSAYIGIRTIRITKGIEEPAPEDTVSPTFSEDWTGCGLPDALVVYNPGEADKSVSVTVTITKPDTTSVSKSANVQPVADGEATLFTTNQLRTVITAHGTYTVTITGYWNTNDAEHQINETIIYTYLEHEPGEPVRENEQAATCDAPASYDLAVYCKNCSNVKLSSETFTEGEALGHKWTDDFDTVCDRDSSHTRDVNVHTDAISVNGDSYTDAPVVDGATVTIKATGLVKWAKSAWGTYGNWVGFRIAVPEGVDAATAIYTRPNGKSSPLADVLDTGKNYASVYYEMSTVESKTAAYTLDWNGDGVAELTVVIDVAGATLHPENCQGGEATCTKQAICEYCGEPYGELKEHRYGELKVYTFCEEEGYITITCGDCGETFDSRVDQEAKDYLVKFPFINVSAKGHDMQETAAEIPAECGKAGTTAVYTCANGCGKTEGGEEIPAKTHRYGELKVYTFCETEGYITITCGECGETFDSREDQEAKDYLAEYSWMIHIEAQGHRYDNDKDTTCNFCDHTRFAHYGSNVDLNGALDYNFYFTPAAGEIEGYYAVIEKNGVETTIELKDDMLNGSTYQITLPGVPAKEMVEEMTITIYDAEGNPVSEPVTDSALLYAKRVLASDAFSTEAKTMVVDMLNYIAAAQEYFGYKADQLVTAGLTSEEKALGTQENPVCENNYTRSNEYYYGTNFDLENNISMNMYVTGIGEDGYGVIKYTNHLGEDIELTIQAADCQLSGSYYVFVVEGFVTADGACSEVEAKFYDGNDQLVVEVVDSLESYVARGAATYPWLYEVMKFANSTYEYLH